MALFPASDLQLTVHTPHCFPWTPWSPVHRGEGSKNPQPLLFCLCVPTWVTTPYPGFSQGKGLWDLSNSTGCF